MTIFFSSSFFTSCFVQWIYFYDRWKGRDEEVLKGDAAGLTCILSRGVEFRFINVTMVSVGRCFSDRENT